MSDTNDYGEPTTLHERLDRLRQGDHVTLHDKDGEYPAVVMNRTHSNGREGVTGKPTVPGSFTLALVPTDPDTAKHFPFSESRDSCIKREAPATTYHVYVNHRRKDYLSERTYWSTHLKADYVDDWGNDRTISHGSITGIDTNVALAEREPTRGIKKAIKTDWTTPEKVRQYPE